jgi:hypothetical protein
VRDPFSFFFSLSMCWPSLLEIIPTADGNNERLFFYFFLDKKKSFGALCVWTVTFSSSRHWRQFRAPSTRDCLNGDNGERIEKKSQTNFFLYPNSVDGKKNDEKRHVPPRPSCIFILFFSRYRL